MSTPGAVTVTVQLPTDTVAWLDAFRRHAGSNALNTGDQVAELVRMREREDGVRTGTWDQNKEAVFLAFQKSIGNGR